MLLLALSPVAGEGSDAEQVLLVFNKREHGSEEIARYYSQRRGVPEAQIVGLRIPVTEAITRDQFVEEVQGPIASFLDDGGYWVYGPPQNRAKPGKTGNAPKVVGAKIRYLVLCRGVPLKIEADPNRKEAEAIDLPPELQRNESSVDSELACLPLLKGRYVLTGPLQNPTYGVTNPAAIHPTNGLLMVSRLDGPTVEVARSLVDKSMEAESNGFWGEAYFDLRNATEPALKQGDDWIRSASELCGALGMETRVDENAGTFPRGYPMSHIAVYVGWYAEHVNGPFLDEPVEFMPGALAYHLHSFSAASLRTLDRYWVGPLLARGATLSLGCVHEPYLGGTPDIAVLVSRLYHLGFDYGEAAWASQSVISWMTTVVGDPLFMPFRAPSQELLTQFVDRGDPLIQWWHLRIVDLNIIKGVPKTQAVLYLEELPATKKSAILTEKLANLYSELGKPTSALRAWQTALNLNPSTKQRIRLQLQLGKMLTEAGRDEEAIQAYEGILESSPDYSDVLPVYHKLLSLSQKVGDTARIKRFQDEIKKRTGS